MIQAAHLGNERGLTAARFRIAINFLQADKIGAQLFQARRDRGSRGSLIFHKFKVNRRKVTSHRNIDDRITFIPLRQPDNRVRA
jgi:hypothetical protein